MKARSSWLLIHAGYVEVGECGVCNSDVRSGGRWANCFPVCSWAQLTCTTTCLICTGLHARRWICTAFRLWWISRHWDKYCSLAWRPTSRFTESEGNFVPPHHIWRHVSVWEDKMLLFLLPQISGTYQFINRYIPLHRTARARDASGPICKAWSSNTWWKYSIYQSLTLHNISRRCRQARRTNWNTVKVEVPASSKVRVCWHIPSKVSPDPRIGYPHQNSRSCPISVIGCVSAWLGSLSLALYRLSLANPADMMLFIGRNQNMWKREKSVKVILNFGLARFVVISYFRRSHSGHGLQFTFMHIFELMKQFMTVFSEWSNSLTPWRVGINTRW